MSKVMFQILCMRENCGQPMRYDADAYRSSGFMEWFCWNCQKELVTTDLLKTIIPPGDHDE